MTPWRPPHSCAEPGCPVLVQGSASRCLTHRPPSMPANWQRTRRAYLRVHRYCEDCHTERSADVHHILSRINGGGDQWSNLMALCHSCHTRRTNAQDGGGGSARH